MFTHKLDLSLFKLSHHYFVHKDITYRLIINILQIEKVPYV